MSNMTGAKYGAESAYPSRESDTSTPVIGRVCVAHVSFYVMF